MLIGWDTRRVRTASPDVVQLLERGFDCWNRRAIEEMVEMYTPDAEVDVSKLLPDENVLRGRDQIRAYYDRMWETWSGFGWRPTEFLELGEGHVDSLPVRPRATFVPMADRTGMKARP